MAIQFDVKSLELLAGISVQGRVRLKGILISISGAPATVELKNGNGAVVFSFTGIANGNVYVPVPGDGIVCENGITAGTLSGATVTVFYG